VSLVANSHHQLVAADPDGHVAVRHEGDPSEHLLFGKAGMAAD